MQQQQSYLPVNYQLHQNYDKNYTPLKPIAYPGNDQIKYPLKFNGKNTIVEPFDEELLSNEPVEIQW